jgi:hypothetical protein
VQRSEVGQRAVLALRLLSGVSFLTLGFADKIWNPDRGTAFLQRYPHFNVFRLAGLDTVTDDVFVLLAGVVVATIGALLISGLLTRLVIPRMFVPFNATVPFLPPVEMLGHLPIFGVMYLPLVYGAGSRWREARFPTQEGSAGDRSSRPNRPPVDRCCGGAPGSW